MGKNRFFDTWIEIRFKGKYEELNCLNVHKEKSNQYLVLGQFFLFAKWTRTDEPDTRSRAPLSQTR